MLRIAFLASELTPFAKTGGLADVAEALPRTLGKLGHDVRVFVPLYGSIDGAAHGLEPVEVSTEGFALRKGTCRSTSLMLLDFSHARPSIRTTRTSRSASCFASPAISVDPLEGETATV